MIRKPKVWSENMLVLRREGLGWGWGMIGLYREWMSCHIKSLAPPYCALWGRSTGSPNPWPIENFQLYIWLLTHQRLSFPGGVHIHTRQPSCCYIIKGMIFSSFQPWESAIRTILYHNHHSSCLSFPTPPTAHLVLNGRYFQGLLPTYLCPTHSFHPLKLATFPSSCLTC